MTDFNDDLEKCLEVLHEGGTILYPTDTIWGLGCDATSAAAVQKIIDIKGKPAGKGLIVLLATERDLFRYTGNPDPAIFNYLAAATKPVTVIYEQGLNVADEVLNEDGSIAIRLINEDFCRHLLKRFKKPIVSTSANLHGQPSPQNFKNISPEIKKLVNYIVSIKQSDEKNNIASSIVKWQNGALFTVRN